MKARVLLGFFFFFFFCQFGAKKDGEESQVR